MLSEQRDDELKNAKQMADREHLRDRLKDMHNNSLMVRTQHLRKIFDYSSSKRSGSSMPNRHLFHTRTTSHLS
jgi:hypothetical protein